MNIWLRQRLAVGLGASLLIGALVGFATRAGAWPKGIPYPDPKKVETRTSLPTPRQRYQGFDRQVVITANSEGVGVANAKLHFSRNGKNGTIPIIVSRDFANTGARNQCIVPLKLAQVPTQLGQLTLSGDVFLLNYSWNSRKGARYKRSPSGEMIRIPDPADNFKIVVRRAGQGIKPPQVSTFRPFGVASAKVVGPSLFSNPAVLDLSGKKSGRPLRRDSASVLVTLKNARGEAKQPSGKVGFDNVRLVTANREVHPEMDGSHGQIITQLTNDRFSDKDEPVNYFFGCNFKHIPASKGALYFQAAVSVDNCWPVPISVRVR